MLWTKLKDELIKSANIVYVDNKIMRDLALCQAILESDLLGDGSKLQKDAKNLFGIKAAGDLGFVQYETTEYEKGIPRRIMSKFGKNSSYLESFKQHRRVLNLTRYKLVWKSDTIMEAAWLVKKAGYATDPNYDVKLIKIYSKYIKA